MSDPSQHNSIFSNKIKKCLRVNAQVDQAFLKSPLDTFQSVGYLFIKLWNGKYCPTFIKLTTLSKIFHSLCSTQHSL